MRSARAPEPFCASQALQASASLSEAELPSILSACPSTSCSSFFLPRRLLHGRRGDTSSLGEGALDALAPLPSELSPEGLGEDPAERATAADYVAPPPSAGAGQSSSWASLGRPPVRWELRSGALAPLALGSCLAQTGETAVLAAVSSSSEARGGWARRDPSQHVQLEVDYREKQSSVGRIPSTYVKREAAAGEWELLTSRRMEAALRPALVRGLPQPLDLSASVLAADARAEPDLVALTAASAALAASGLPWLGPVGVARVVAGEEEEGRSVNGGQQSSSKRLRVLVNPSPADGAALKKTTTVLVAATARGLTFMDVQGAEVSEEELLELVDAGLEALAPSIQAQLALRPTSSPSTLVLRGADPAAALRVRRACDEHVFRALFGDVFGEAAVQALGIQGSLLEGADEPYQGPALEPLLDSSRRASPSSSARAARLHEAKAATLARLRALGAMRSEFTRVAGSGAVSARDLDAAFCASVLSALRRAAFGPGLRPGGRALGEARPLALCAQGLPVVHGSALAQWGWAQVSVTATVGGRGDAQKQDDLFLGSRAKRLFAHVDLPAGAEGPCDGGAAAVLGAAGSGGLGRLDVVPLHFLEAALLPVFPPESACPFAVRLHVDVLAGDGALAGGAVAGACLALIKAGVSVERLVAAGSVGLLRRRSWSGQSRTSFENEAGSSLEGCAPYLALDDPDALECALGDGVVEVAGTRLGVTAVRLELAGEGTASREALAEALRRAKAQRLARLEVAARALLEAGLPVPLADEGWVRELRPAPPTLASPFSISPAERSRRGTLLEFRIPETMVARVVGTAGAVLRGIEERCQARVELSSTGAVHVHGSSRERAEAAQRAVMDASGESLAAGEAYWARVVGLKDFGAMIQMEETGVACLLHVSEISPQRVKSVGDVLAVGDRVRVLCLGRDDRGNIKISRKALLVGKGREGGEGA